MATKPVASKNEPNFPAHWHILAMSPLRDLVGLFTNYLNVKDTIAFLSSCRSLWDIRSPRCFKQLDFEGTRPTLEKFTDFVTSCVNVVAINLDECKSTVTDAWFEQIGEKCRKLKMIEFSSVPFLTGKSITHLARCKNLQQIFVHGSVVWTALLIESQIVNFPRLLSFTGWSVDDEFIKALAKSTKCGSFVFYHPCFTDHGIGHLKNLRKIKLHFATEITGPGLAKLIQNCPGLQELEILDTPFDDRCLQALQQCRELRVLKLIGNLCTITLEEVIEVLKNNPNIVELVLSIDKLNDEWFRRIAPYCPSVKYLTIFQGGKERNSLQMHKQQRRAEVITSGVDEVRPKERRETYEWQMRLKAARTSAFPRTALLHSDFVASVKNGSSRKPLRVKKETS